MRIFHVVSAPAAGGAEVYVKDLAKVLVKQGHSMAVGFLGHAEDIGRSVEYEKEFLAELDAAGVKWFFIGNECRRKPWLGVNRVREFVKSESIDIYHSHLPFGVPFAFGLGVPKVYTHHSINPRLNWLTYRLFNLLIDRYIGISEVCAEKLSVYSRRSVIPILNGVDSRKFPKRQKPFPVDGEVLRASVVGRIHPHKGYYFLGQVIQSLPEQVRERIRVRIAGEGDPDYTQKLKNFFAEAGIRDNFEFLGNRSDVPQLLNESDLFLMSSEQEGLPISLIEATIAGLPCIVTDVGGCSEIIEMCENGAAIRYGDVEGYARLLRELVENPDKLRIWSANGRKNLSSLDIEVAAERHLELYSELLRG